MKVNYSNRRALVNGGVSALQVVVTSAVLLVSYRLCVQTTGADDFGLYSLYFAFGTLTQLGGLGFSVGAARHVAVAWGEDRQHDLRPLILLSGGVPAIGAAVTAGVLYLALDVYSGSALSAEEQRLAASLAPVVLAAACLTPVSTAAQSLMDGTSRTYVRSAVVISAALTYLVVVVLALPSQGVLALAYGTLAQQGIVAVILLSYVTHLAGGTAPGSWLPTNLPQVARYNLKLHALTAPTLAYEPVAKAVLQAVAGVSAIAYYEIANRLLQQVSALVHAANQAVVPLVAVRAAQGLLSAGEAFRRSFQAVFPVTLVGFAGALIMLPLVSTLVFGETSPAVLGFGALLSVGWICNCLSGPAYFVGVTLDDFRSNMVANYLVLAVLLVAGVGLGLVLGAYGVACGVALALVVGSLLVNVDYVRRSGLSVRDLLPLSQAGFAAATTVLVVVVLLLSVYTRPSALVPTVATGAVVLLLLSGAVLARHPVMNDLRGRARHVGRP